MAHVLRRQEKSTGRERNFFVVAFPLTIPARWERIKTLETNRPNIFGTVMDPMVVQSADYLSTAMEPHGLKPVGLHLKLHAHFNPALGGFIFSLNVEIIRPVEISPFGVRFLDMPVTDKRLNIKIHKRSLSD